MDEAVALEFAADVASAVASVRELAVSAQDLATEAEMAAEGCGALTASAEVLAGATEGLTEAEYEAGAAAAEMAAEQKSAASAAGDLALAQANLKVASADARAAVADLAAVQATAGKDSTEYAAQLDAVAAAMGRESAAASQLKGAQEEQAAAAAQAKAAAEGNATAQEGAAAASDTAAKASATAGDAQAGAAGKADVAAAGGLAKYKMALLGIGIGSAVAVDAAGKFQDQTTHLVTDAGETASQLGMVQQGMLKISAATATSASAIDDGMYHVESGGYHGAQGLAMLQTAAEGARVGGANLDDVTFALVGSMNAYYGATMTAAQASTRSTQMMNELVATTAAGDLKMQDLSTSLHAVTPVAAAAHIAFSQVGGAEATMTAQGMSAKQAAQDLGHTVGQLVNPSKVATKEMALMGINSTTVAQQLGQKGLTGTLAELATAAKEHAGAAGQTYAAAMSKMLNGTVGLNTSLMLTGSHLSDFTKNVSTVQAAADKGGKSVDNWSTIQGTFNFKLDQAKTATKDAGIALGSALLPAVSAILGPLASMLAFIAGNRVAAIAFAVVIGGVLAGALGMKLAGALKDAKAGITLVGDGIGWLAGKMGLGAAATEAQTVATEAATVAQGELDVAMDANPIGLIIIAVMALIGVVLLLITHWHDVAHVFDLVRHDIAAGVDWLVNFVKQHWQLLVEILTGTLLVALVVQNWQKIEHAVMAPVTATINFVKEHWKEIVGWLADPLGMAVMQIRQHWSDIEHVFDEGRHDVAATLDGARHDIAAAWDGARHDAAAILDGARHDAAAAFDGARHDIAAVVDAIPGDVEKGFGLAVKAQETMLDDARHDVATAFDDIRHSVSSGVDDVVNFFTSLPGKAEAQLAKLPGEMLTIGTNVITGLINGIKNAAAAIPGIMSSLASDVASYFTNPLKLFSPSRLFFEHGFNIVQGAINGVKANAPNLLATMRGLGTGVGATGSSLAAGAAAPAGGSTSVHVSVPVTATGTTAGLFTSPQYQQALQSAVQEVTLRYGQLNAGNGLTPMWGR